MKNSFSISIFPKDFTIVGISYEAGTATNTETQEVTPLHRISLGIGIIVFELVIAEKKGEN